MAADIRIDATAVRAIARLAQIELSPAELETLPAELTSILDHVAALDSLDTGDRPADDEPVARGRAADSMREDQPFDSLAPAPAAGFFRVPRVIRSAD